MPTRDELKVHQKAYKKFLAETESLRPDLYRYCRHLTAHPWDAEDLVQETLLNSYARLGWTYFEIADWRAYLFRAATNLWLNEQRRAGRMIYLEDPPAVEAPEPEPPAAALGADVRAALALLLDRLAPQERVALVLKEVFDCPLAEIATHLRTTTGAAKHALHRGREKIAQGPARAETAAAPPPRPEVLEAFVAAFNAHDLDRVVALLREDATSDVVGLVQENNRDDVRRGSLPHTIGAENFARLYAYRGEWIAAIGRYKQGTQEFDGVGTLIRFQTDGARIVNLRSYYFTLDMLKEIVGELGLPADLCDVYFYA